jgi:hypothetical protein
LGMALWVLEHSFKNLERLEKQTKAMLNSWGAGSNNNLTRTVTTNDGNKREQTRVINPNNPAYKNVQDPTGQHAWLFGGRTKR